MGSVYFKLLSSPSLNMPRRRHRTVSPPSPSLDCDSVDTLDSNSPKQPARNAANARERARMRVLSRAFCRLKTTLPWVPVDTKLSKLDTLRLATSYIAHLRAVLSDDGSGDGNQRHPISLTWPFTFQQTGTTLNSNYDSGGCWVNSSRDSEDEDYQNTSHNPQNQNMSTAHPHSQGVIREYAPYYQQYTDSLMHIG